MRTYEELIKASDLCTLAASRCFHNGKPEMVSMWMKKSLELLRTAHEAFVK